jgi:uncharacterized protein with HEPN domain
MRLDSRKHLEDMRQAAQSIAEFVAGKSLDDYVASRLLRAAVEREFEVIGEALKRLLRTDPSAASRITHAARIVSFRNILAHGYDVVEDEVVWDIVSENLAVLRQQVTALLAETDQ